MSEQFFFFDLDGPILDVSEKYYQVYFSILKSHRYDTLTKDQYWQLKREKIPEKNILALTKAEIIYSLYKEERKRIIESNPFLELDQVHDQAYEMLEYLSGKFKLILVTLRSNPNQLAQELAKFDLLRFFSKVLSADGDQAEKWTIKRDLIRDAFGVLSSDTHYFIGDTETDILAGKSLSCKTIGVLSGIRTETLIKACNPDFIISGISDLKKHVNI